MSWLGRVELQAEVDRRREELFGLVSTPEGLRLWLDEAEVQASLGAGVRLRLADAVAVGTVVALDPPQHISYAWDWESAPLDRPGVVAFDLIGHGRRTHLTLRHVGLPPGEQLRLHEDMWRYWFAKLVRAAREG